MRFPEIEKHAFAAGSEMPTANRCRARCIWPRQRMQSDSYIHVHTRLLLASVSCRLQIQTRTHTHTESITTAQYVLLLAHYC